MTSVGTETVTDTWLIFRQMVPCQLAVKKAITKRLPELSLLGAISRNEGG